MTDPRLLSAEQLKEIEDILNSGKGKHGALRPYAWTLLNKVMPQLLAHITALNERDEGMREYLRTISLGGNSYRGMTRDEMIASTKEAISKFPKLQ